MVPSETTRLFFVGEKNTHWEKTLGGEKTTKNVLIWEKGVEEGYGHL